MVEQGARANMRERERGGRESDGESGTEGVRQRERGRERPGI